MTSQIETNSDLNELFSIPIEGVITNSNQETYETLLKDFEHYTNLYTDSMTI